jgi:ATP-dependent DNA ligase
MSYPLDSILIPMGAKDVKDEEKMEALWDDPNYVAEEKYDGSRYLSIGGRFFSRRLSVKDGFPVEKTDNVPHLSAILKRFPNLILDGEVYYEGMTSNEVTSIMGALPDKAIERQKERGWLKYVVFDILRDMDGNWLLDLTWMERRLELEETIERIREAWQQEDPDTPLNIEISEVEFKEKRLFYETIMARGGEGVILKNIKGKYVPDKRPAWNWVKVKKHITDDVVIMGFKPPVKEYEGKELETWDYWEDGKTGQLFTRYPNVSGELLAKDHIPVTKFYFHGWIGAVTFGKYDKDGKLVELGYCSGLSDALRADMSENPEKFVGECMEISAMERTKDGFYRHPQFSRLRPDKNPEECAIGD